MGSDDLTDEQMTWLCNFIHPLRSKFLKLRRKLEHSCLPGDPLFEKVKALEDKVHDLSVWLHYKKCDMTRKR
jgi:hypothetical protein